MPDAKISALTALNSTANLAQLYVPLFKADGSPDNARILASDLLLAAERVDITPAWSGTGVATTPLLVNITDDPGPANGASKLLDLQVGGSSRLSVNKSGDLTIGNGNLVAGGVTLASGYVTVNPTGAPYYMLYLDSGRSIKTSGSSSMAIGGTGVVVNVNVGHIATAGELRWMSTYGSDGSNVDLSLTRDDADRLAQRRGGTAQKLSVYNTYTDASNYERGVFDWKGTTNTLRIGTEHAGTGAARAVSIVTGGTERVNISSSGLKVSGPLDATTAIGNTSGSAGIGFFASGASMVLRNDGVNTMMLHGTFLSVLNGRILGFEAGDSGTPDVALARPAAGILGITNGSTGGGAVELSEMSAPATPAANKARIFSRDNGSGKTQVCILLPDGVITVLATET